jgi:hypothetical protein
VVRIALPRIRRAALIHTVDSDAGTGTCQNRPGGRGYEFQDARQYAEWGADYLKYDWCNHSTQNSEASYSIMPDALKKSGRPIVFSLCEWGSKARQSRRSSAWCRSSICRTAHFSMWCLPAVKRA